ncbi:hypothetical protein [Pedobacter sp. SYSU D00535]|uniref:hypothetical protein n=1 Tax=Pedobacter sp. SYSU D00535 TaxID=2810308 RepID=UPI001A962D52|nr:hypothetical protein [Pedobacter sp. SYSU D00535]
MSSISTANDRHRENFTDFDRLLPGLIWRGANARTYSSVGGPSKARPSSAGGRVGDEGSFAGCFEDRRVMVGSRFFQKKKPRDFRGSN